MNELINLRLRSRSRDQQRQGSLYVSVLGTCLVVGLLAVTMATVERSRRATLVRHDLEERARLLAESGLATGRELIETTPTWRTSAVNGRIALTLQMSSGECNLLAYDPADNNLTDDVDEPYVIEATGIAGECRHQMSATFSERSTIPDSIAQQVVAGGSLALSSATIRGDADLMANGSVTAASSIVSSRVSAAGSVVGSTYQDRNTSGVATVSIPSPNDIFNTLSARATTIPASGFPAEGPELIENGTFENGSSEPWVNENESGGECDIGVSSTSPRSGTRCLQVENRSSYGEGAVYSIKTIIQSGKTYRIRVWLRNSSGSRDYRIVAGWKRSTSFFHTYATGDYVSCGTGWTLLTLTFTPTWTGTLSSALFRVESKLLQSSQDHFLDDVEFREVISDLKMSQVVLSATNNPYGSTNAEGIYLVNCGGAKFVMDECRIMGTLLLKDPGADSKIGPGGVSWSPHSPDLPALVVSRTSTTSGQSFRFELSGAMLSEPGTTKNFNPSGSPHPDGTVDSDMQDAYECRIRGAILIDGALSWAGQSILEEPMMATGSISISGTLLLEPRRELERLKPSWLGGSRQTVMVGSGPLSSGY